jgi:hypothetical protein
MYDPIFGEGVTFLEATPIDRRLAVYKCTQILLQGLIDEATEVKEKENLLKSLEHLGIAEIKNLISHEASAQPTNVIPFPQANQRHSRQTVGAGLFSHQPKRKD